MNMNTQPAQSVSRWNTARRLAVGLPALLMALPLLCAERGGAPRSAPRAMASRPIVVQRSTYGSVHRANTYAVQRPAEVRPEPARGVEVRREVSPRPQVAVRRDVNVDVYRRHAWNDFAFGRRLGTLPLGFLALQIGGALYDYCDGIYYQPGDGGYQEVYPPVGAAIPQLPDGAIQIVVGGQTYFYVGGAFYLQQPDGTFAIVPPPMGAVVPELPPGASQVSLNGTVAYQFNGVYYEPVFVNGVTQYETFTP